MDWKKRTISPRKPEQSQKSLLRNPSPPLMRFFGSIGFSVGGLGIYYIGLHFFNIDPDFWQAAKWDAKTILFIIVTFAAALIGSVLGAGMGISIDVKSKKVNHTISVLWHYLANGLLIWIFLLMMCLHKILGKEKLMVLLDKMGKWNFSIISFGIASVGCLLIAVILLTTGTLKEQDKPRVGPCFLLSLPIALAMGYTQFNLLSIDSTLWTFISFTFAFLLHPVSAYLIIRDKNQRLQVIEK